MEPSSSSTQPAPLRQKLKFVPKPPPPRVQKLSLPKPEVVEAEDAILAKDLLRRLNEASEIRMKKNEKKAVPAQVAFGHGAGPTAMRSYGRPRARDNGGQNIGTDSSVIGLKDEEYEEPWDYCTNYPLTLPMRKPYSGNPELLNKEEFKESLEDGNLGEESRTANNLRFLEDNSEGMLFFQFPEVLPMTRRMSSAKDGQASGSTPPTGVPGRHHRVCTLDELPGGLMGKILIYQSEAVKMKLGDTIYDIASGLSCGFAQDVVALDTQEKRCCALGEVTGRLILTPDIDSVISSVSGL